MFDLQEMVGGALNVFGDLMAVRGTEEKRAQDKHVEGALKEFGAV